jgi:hypothetical protein
MIYAQGTLIQHKKGYTEVADGTSDYSSSAWKPVGAGLDTVNETKTPAQESLVKEPYNKPTTTTAAPAAPASSPYTTKLLPSGKVEIYENGKAISTGVGFTPEYAASFGYKAVPSPTLPSPNAQVSPALTQQASNIASQVAQITPQVQAITPKPTQTSTQGATPVPQAPQIPTTPQTATPAQTYNAQTPVVNTATAQMTANQEAGQKASDQAQADLTTQFKDYQKQMADAQTESNAKTEALLKKMGEDSTANMLKQFQDTQASIAEGYKTYFDEQAKYLAEMQNQPSAVAQLQKFREEQGLPQMEKELATADQIILQTETMLSNIEGDIRKRTEGLPVSEAAARRLQAMESAPLSKQLSEQLNSRQRVAAGLEAKLNTVNEFMSAAQSDIATKKETSLAKLGFAKEKAEFTGDLATDSMNFYTTIQDNMNKIDTLRLSQIQSDTQYKQALAEAGFSYYQMATAEKKADIKDRTAFQQELVKIKLESDLKSAYKDYSIQVLQGEDGSFYSVATDKQTGTSEVQNLGITGETAQNAPSSTSIVNTNGHSYLINDLTGETIRDLGVSNSEISSGGAITGSTTAGDITPEKLDKLNKVRQAIENVKNSEGKSLGMSSYLNFVKGTSQYSFQKKVDNLVNLLTLENMGLMKGVLSDSDMKVIRSASSRIDTGLSEKEFNMAISEIETTINNALDNTNSSSSSNDDPLGIF